MKDLSAYYVIKTPREFPYLFWKDGYWKLEAFAKCVECGNSELQLFLRTHRYYEDRGALAPRKRTKAPNPNDDKIINAFMLNACNHGCGCANPMNFMRECFIRPPRVPLMDCNLCGVESACQGKVVPVVLKPSPVLWPTSACSHPEGVRCPTCERREYPVEWLKYAPHFHSKNCSIGQMKRTGPFHISGQQLQVAKGRS